jgi:hypothetical protein
MFVAVETARGPVALNRFLITRVRKRDDGNSRVYMLDGRFVDVWHTWRELQAILNGNDGGCCQ